MSLRAIAALTLLSLLVAGAAPARQADSLSAAAVEPDVFVIITPSGFDPEEVEVVPGQTIHWTNESGVEQSVTAESGLFESGPIPPGGGFSMALDIGGTFAYASADDADLIGTVQVVLEELPGPASGLAEENIPDVPFPPVEEDDLGEHPDLMVLAHRSHLLVGFVEGATVAEANAALDAAGTPIVGGLPDLGVVLVAAPDTPDFSGLVTAVETLRGHPAVEFAALDAELTTSSLPRAAEAITETFPNAPWVWDPSLPEAIGMGGNWGLEASRFPQAWNLLESIKRSANAVQTGILDEGFDDGHPDLANVLQTEQLCRAPGFGLLNCTLNVRSSDHGNHVAGTIGGEYDNTGVVSNRSLGVSGANPVASMHGVPALLPTLLLPALFGNGMELWELFLETADPSSLSMPRLPNLRVINFSMGFDPPGEYDSCLDDDDSDGAGCEGFTVTPGAVENSCEIHPRTSHTLLGDIDCDGGEQLEWWDSHPDQVCGPGDDDDGVPGTGWCTPNNEDGWLEETAEWGEAAREIAERASELDVAIVQSAGNSSGSYSASFCPPSGGACSPVLYAGTTAYFGWASDHWTATTPNPIFVVEAIGPGLARADFSNVRNNVPRLPCPRTSCAYVSAPGEVVLSSIGGVGYDAYQGTSMAAPHVTGLISYLLAYDSSLELDDVRNAVMQWAREDTTGGAQPRIDAFASLLSLPGAAKALVDVNDPSKDGNRRRILGPFGTPLGDDLKLSSAEGFYTEPDGQVDMRDFRRFRDAWLLTSGNDDDLNGSPHHVKKDLNFDGCTHVENDDQMDCAIPESTYPRFDFNGNGQVGLVSETKVPLNPDGTPAAASLDGTMMTDLEVLASQWESDPELTEGWTPGDLNADLVLSGDLEIHADDFFAAGAEEVEVTVTADGADLPARTINASDEFTDVDGERRNFIVVTVPASPATVEVTAAATIETPGGDTETIESPTQEISVELGEDKRLDICALALEADPNRIPADGEATSAIEATLGENCPVESVGGKTVFFTVDPAGSGHGSVNPTGLSTDENGVAATTFTAGTIPATYTITATADLGDGQEAKGSVTVETLPPLRIHYLWRQTNVSWSESGTTRWGAVPGMPDCTTAVEYCIDSFSIGSHPTMPSLGFERSGILSGADDAFELSEEVLESLNRSRRTWTKSNPDGSNVASGTEEFAWSVTVADLERYQEHALPPTVSVEDRPEGLVLRGLKAVGELGYRHSLVTTFRDPPAIVAPIELHATRGELLLAPRGDGSALRFAVDTSRPIAFERNLDDTFQPYQFCGTFTKDLTTQPGYRVADSSEWVPGATDLTRKTTYAPGDRPMPVGPGSLTVRYAFAAVATYSPDPPEVVLPDCSQNNPPEADFEYTPAAPKEGRLVRFFDRSTDPENNVDTWTWSFGGAGSPPDTATKQDPYFVYHDDGAFTVGLAVEDTEGETDSTSKLLSVANLPPEAGFDDAAGQRTVRIETSFRLWDPGRADQAAIGYELTRTDTGALLSSGTLPAGRYTLGFPPGFFSTAGSYPFTLTATDKDGASVSDDATITVTEDPPPPPPPEDPPTPTCDPTVELDAQEQAFVEEVNEYRAENGLDPVVASPTLTKASERHVNDMVENNFIGHDGSDGSTPAQRAADAGYPSQSTGENLAFNFETAVDVLLGWKSSQTGHNENMLNPKWKAVGIARKEGPTTMLDPPQDAWWWATMYGDVVDCPAAESSSTSSLSAASETTKLSSGGGAGVAAPDASVEPETIAPPPLEAEPGEVIWVEENAGTAMLAADDAAPALAAFTISDVTPTAGVPVTLTNRSRDVTGDPIGATLDVGSGPSPIGADGSAAMTFSAGTFDVELAVPTPAGGALAVTRTLTVSAPPPPPPPAPVPQGPSPDTTGPAMGIAKTAVTASKKGAVPVRLTCPAGETLCTGTLTLRSKGKIRLRPALERLAQVTFGRKAFTLQGGQTAPVTIKLSRKHRALLARLKKVRVLAVVEARDAAGNLRTTQGTFLLRAPKRR